MSVSSKRLVSLTHNFLTLTQTASALLFVHLEILPLALLAALAGKWRVVSLHPYRLWRNLRANSCDIVVIVSSVLLMDFYRTNSSLLFGFTAFLALWLIIIKPAESRVAVAAQAACCQFLGLSTIWLYGHERGLHGIIVIALATSVGLVAGRHVTLALTEDKTPERRVLPIIWAIGMSQLAWLSWLWAITYRLPGDLLVPQIALLSTLLGFFAIQPFFAETGRRRRLNVSFVWQQIVFCLIIVLAIIVMTPWTSGS